MMRFELTPIQIEMAKECSSPIKTKLDRLITAEEYYIKLMELNQKYPMESHYPPLSKEMCANYYISTDKNGNRIQPFSFKEAAEMYIRHKERVERENPIPKKQTKFRTFIEASEPKEEDVAF